MPTINVKVNIIQASQPIPITATLTNIEALRKGNYREQLIKEYTTCENVVFYPVEILKKEKETDFYYPHNRYQYIIDLMKKFELCYEIDKKTVLIPDLLEVQEPEFEFKYDNSLKFVIEYDFLPRSVMPRLAHYTATSSSIWEKPQL